MHRWIFAVALLAGTLPACQIVAFGDDEVPNAGLTDARWELERMVSPAGRIVEAPNDGYVYWIHFGPDGTMRAADACNRCGATYTAIGGQIMYGENGACTDQLCTGQQIDYQHFIFRADRFELRGGRLELHGPDFVLVHRPATTIEVIDDERR